MPGLKFSVRFQHLDKVTIFHCKGRIVFGDGLELLRQALLCQQHNRLVTLDLAEVDGIDAAGLGVLASVGASVHLQLVNCSWRVAEVLALTGLHRVIELTLPERAATGKDDAA